MTGYWCETAWLPDGPADGVRIETAGDRIASVERGPAATGDTVLHGVTFAGFANVHSHLFHRFLRGRTHGGRGDFWTWRQQMYRLASGLDPDSYYAAARAVFAEMLAAGYTAVGEFHYLHHRPGGEPYPDHDMEMAIVTAARETGIRLTLLDTCYLSGGFGQPLGAEQLRFSDGDGPGWLSRWERLRERIGDEPGVTLGAAAHSVRAVGEKDLAFMAANLPDGVPLHVHVSEQTGENEQCRQATGLTPTGLLARAGVFSKAGRPLTAVHATHLTDDDIRMLGDARAVIGMCPSTEADLADGVGPARRLADAGAPIALGSDQNAVIDPLLEARGLEAGERLTSGERGRFTTTELTSALSESGYHSLGITGGRIEPGRTADLVSVDRSSMRTLGTEPDQIALAATAADVHTVVVGGRAAGPGAAGDAESAIAATLERLP